jgi:hypothetical protein
MALFKQGVLGAVSGGLGGAEFAGGKGGSVVKRAKPTGGSPSPAQLRSRALMEGIRERWRALTTAQKAAWGEYGKLVKYVDRFGVIRSRNGFQAFASIPCDWGEQGSEQYITVPPVDSFIGAPAFTVTAGAPNTLVVLFSDSWYLQAEYLGVDIARMCRNQTRKITRWYGMGMVYVNMNNPVLFSDALLRRDVVLISGELIAVRVYAWSPALCPNTRPVVYTTVV